MDFTLTSEQRLIVETVRSFVENELYPHEDEVERLDEIPVGLAGAIRGKALAAGLYAANMPAELGGGGLDALSVVLVERELGRASGHTEGDTMSVAEPVRVSVEGQVLVVTLDRAKANAVDVATSRALYEAFDRLRRDPRLRAGILTGAGDRFFCAGWDLKAAAAGEAIEADHGPGGFAGITEFFDIGKPVIAAVNGLALGGGFELALAADLVVAADHAEFALTEVTRGLVADAGGLLRLPARLPRAIAVEYLLTGRRIPAAEAAGWGLVNRVVPAAELMMAARGLADAICSAAPLAVAAVLEILRETEGTDVRAGYSLLRDGSLPTYRRMLGSRDAREGALAFAERRAPRWAGE